MVRARAPGRYFRVWTCADRSSRSAGAASRWRPGNPLLDDYVLSLDRGRPSAGLLPRARPAATRTTTWSASTASSPAPVPRRRTWRCSGAGAGVERRPRATSSSQDLIYVGGGSLVSLLGVWRGTRDRPDPARGVGARDRPLRAERRRALLVLEALTAYYGSPERGRAASAMLPWSFTAHYDSEPEQQGGVPPPLDRGMPSGYAADDGAALHFVGTRPPPGRRVAAGRGRLRAPARSARRDRGSPRGRLSGRSGPVARGRSRWRRSPRRSMRDAPDRRPRRPRVPLAPGRARDRRHLLDLTGAERPASACFRRRAAIPRRGSGSFYSVLDGFECEASHISLFRLERERVDLQPSTCSTQDLIYVAGGSMLNLVAIWRAHGLDRILARGLAAGRPARRAERGRDVLVRAGDHRVSAGRPRPADGFGLLPGSLCVHYGRDPERRETSLDESARGSPRAMRSTTAPASCSRAPRPVEAFAGDRGARVVRVEREGAGVRRAASCDPIPLRQELAAGGPGDRGAARAAADEGGARPGR